MTTVEEEPDGLDKPLKEPPGEEGDDSVNAPGDLELPKEGDLEDAPRLEDEDDQDEFDSTPA